MSNSEHSIIFPKTEYRFCLFMASLSGFKPLQLHEITSKASLFSA